MDKRPVRGSEQPGSEPEIIPPHAAHPFERHQRIFVGRVGPVGLFAGVLAVALLAIIALLLLLGLFLVAIPVAVLLLAGAMIAGWWKEGVRSPR
jgi:hypothetical protein